MEEKSQKHLPWFGIGKILPYLGKVRKKILVMVIFGLVGSATDILLPLFQRFALDRFVRGGVFEALAAFTAA